MEQVGNDDHDELRTHKASKHKSEADGGSCQRKSHQRTIERHNGDEKDPMRTGEQSINHRMRSDTALRCVKEHL